MSDLGDVGAPFRPANDVPPGDDEESRRLRGIDGQLPLAARIWIPAAAEEAFYRLNHLDGHLIELFGDAASDDPDEDDIEELAPDARGLVKGHVLLDAWVDAFYDACTALAARLRVRRPGEPGRSATAGRPALLALRAVWADAWEDDAIVARLRGGGPLRPVARPVVVHADDRPLERTALPELDGAGWVAYAAADGAITRLASPARPGTLESER